MRVATVLVMIRTVAVEGYRSLHDLTTELGAVTVVTGPNGSGKTSVYRALRLMADLVREGALATLAREGGMRSAMYAGPRGEGPAAIRLGFADDDLSYAVDLGVPTMGPFQLDPEIKTEVVWAGPVLRPATVLAERRGPSVRLRDDAGTWQTMPWRLAAHESLMGALVEPTQAPEIFAIRQQAARWRFYDHLRTDVDAAARRPGPATFTPVLAPGGDDLAAALLTIVRVGWEQTLDAAIAEAFDSTLEIDDDEGVCHLALRQPGLRRPMRAVELSDGTLKYLMLAAALLSPRPPALLVLNEPETSLHPSLLPALAGLVLDASERTQVVVVTHAAELVRGLRGGGAAMVELTKGGGATAVAGREGLLDRPAWSWPKR